MRLMGILAAGYNMRSFLPGILGYNKRYTIKKGDKFGPEIVLEQDRLEYSFLPLGNVVLFSHDLKYRFYTNWSMFITSSYFPISITKYLQKSYIWISFYNWFREWVKGLRDKSLRRYLKCTMRKEQARLRLNKSVNLILYQPNSSGQPDSSPDSKTSFGYRKMWIPTDRAVSTSRGLFKWEYNSPTHSQR